MNRSTRSGAVLLLVLLALLPACGDDGGTGPEAPVATSLTIDPSAVTLTAIGDSVRLEASVQDQNGNAIDGAAVAWTNEDPSVATVDPDGWVVAVAAGTTTIRATSGELEEEATITVSQVVGSITLTVPDSTLAEGESVQLAAVVADSNGVAITGADVTWTTSDSTAAVVDTAGRVTGVWGDATATITATAGGASAQADITVLGKLVFISDRTGGTDLYLMNTDGSGVLRLTTSDSIDNYPDWSPDGSKIVFVSSRDGYGEIYVMNVDGTGITRLTTDSASAIWPAWSPDGSKIAFASDRDGDEDIYVMNADGTGVVRLTESSGQDIPTAWSPDGSKLLFTTDRDGNLEIYVMAADGSGQTNLTEHIAGDAWAKWRPRPVN